MRLFRRRRRRLDVLERRVTTCEALCDMLCDAVDQIQIDIAPPMDPAVVAELRAQLAKRARP